MRCGCVAVAGRHDEVDCLIGKLLVADARAEAAQTKLRDHFAGQALAGLLASPMRYQRPYEDEAILAWDFADAMLATRGNDSGNVSRKRAEPAACDDWPG